MRSLVLAALLLAALLLAAGCTTTPSSNATTMPTRAIAFPTNTTSPASNTTGAVYIMNDSGRTVPLGLQQNLSILLPENPTTGFSWNATVTDGLLITDTAYTPGAQAGTMTGVGGTRNWTVRGVQVGTQRFSAVYVRPWEPNITAQEFNLTVQVS